MARSIYSYDIEDSETPIVINEASAEEQAFLGESNRSYSENSLTIGNVGQKVEVIQPRSIVNNNITQTVKNVEGTYSSYDYEETQIPVITTQSQSEMKQSQIDKLQNVDIDSLITLMNSLKKGTTDAAGDTSEETNIIKQGGVVNVVTNNSEILEANGITKDGTDLDAGKWG